MKFTAAAAVLIFAAVLSGCAEPGVATAAVIVPSVEYPERADVHLIFISRQVGGRQTRQAAVLYLPYRSISGLIAGSLLEVGEAQRSLEHLLGIVPDAVYRSSAPQRMQAVRLLERLEEFDGDLVFSYGRDAELFWELLHRHAGDLADQQVLPYLRQLYDETQISEAEFARGLEALGGTESPIRHIPLIFDDHGNPHGEELLHMTVRQIFDAIEGVR